MTLEHGLSSDAVEQHRIRYGKNELPTDPGAYDDGVSIMTMMVYIHDLMIV